MKKARYSLLPLLIFLFIISCKKDISETLIVDPPPIPDSVAVYPSREVQIVLPSNTGIDLSTCTVLSLSVNSKVDSAGKSKAAYNKGYPGIAYVFDKDNHFIMAGFLTDTTGTISAASTAKVLLYYSYGMMLQQCQLTPHFINEIDQLDGVKSWISAFEELFKNDPLVVDKGAFVETLKTNIKKLVSGRAAMNSANKISSDIQVDANDIRSGLQIFEDGLSKFSVMNAYRRRAHAFIYKVAAKNKKGDEILSKDINSNTIADKDVIIDPVAGVTSFTGVVGAWIEGKDMDFAAVKSGPQELLLEDNESEATYKLRIVGAGAPGTNKAISDQEISKLTRLEIETFAIDFLFPVIMELVGNKDDINKITGKDLVSGPIVEFIDFTDGILKAIPGAYDEVRKGKYDMALQKTVEGLVDGINAAIFEDLVKITAYCLERAVGSVYYVPGSKHLFSEVERKIKVLKGIDQCLFATDIARMAVNIGASKQLEEWSITARASRVTLLPKESEVVPLLQQKITCEIKNFQETGGDTHAYFVWSTTGKYGKLTDTKGHTNLASFESADHEVFYYSNASLSDLSDGDNLEYIYVTAYFGGVKIGTDTAVINVKKEVNTFTVSLTPNVGLTKRYSEIYKKDEYNFGPPYYTADFAAKQGAKSYSIRVIKKDNTKAAPTLYYPSQMTIINGVVKYMFYVGPLALLSTLDVDKANKEIKRQEDYMAEVGHKAIEVTVNY